MAEICVSDGRKRSGWFWMDNKVFDVGLDPYEFFVYAFLVRIADRGSEIARISTRNLAKRLGISRQRAINALRRLEKLNMIQIKPQLGKNGNRQANMYVLTSQDEWVVYQKDQGWSTRKTRVVYEIDQGGLRERPGVVYEIDHPPTKEDGRTLDNQGEDKTGEKASKIYNNKNLYINNHHHQYKESGKVDDGGDAKKEEFSVSRKGSAPTTTNGDSFSGSGENNSHPLKPSAFLRKNSAASGLAEGEPERIYDELRAKWDKYLRDIELERLTLAQAIFFLENSALPPKQTLEAILRDDRNPNIKNPVGTLYSTLPLKDDKYRWLLKWKTIEDEEWYRFYKVKSDEIKQICKNLGVSWEERVPSSIEEARDALKSAEMSITKTVWNRISEEEKKRLKKTVQNMFKGRQTTKEEKQKMLRLLILDEHCGTSAELFDI